MRCERHQVDRYGNMDAMFIQHDRISVAVTILNDPTDFDSNFDSGALGRRADYNINAVGRSTNTICLGRNCGARLAVSKRLDL